MSVTDDQRAALAGGDLEVRHGPLPPVPGEVRQTLRVNGRPSPRGRGSSRPGGPRWQVRLGLAWDSDTWKHAWLSLVCEPPRPGVASGVWLLPLDVLEQSMRESVTTGAVHLAPDGEDRMWLEVTATVGAAARPWAVSVPRRWVWRFLDEVAQAARDSR